ncbi:S41 family peptidase [Cytobacillus firmus]|uniref:S41 family peptidase n=1 Tax=Cytobacillus firmus TaxID=1399 RepID=UPI0018CF8796|nr:S41 family peptidase [Cytobacillus firmus]MBG9549203.1 carboxyl-terminal protease [Cytobacillus firmus]MBG9602050.1 carboxyl-terminal protease [Cytobacillus firmus]MED1940477.1 S41 family peptidase [Cytobacillus firmus]
MLLKRYFSVLLALILLVNVPAASASAGPVEEARELIRDYYVEELPDWVLAKPSIKEMVRYLDLYSVYMSAEEFAEFTNAIEQQLVGIGVVLEESEKGIRIMSVISEGPAAAAGLKPGDIIVKADGTSLAGESVQTAISLISGKENTSVTLTFINSETGSLQTITIPRRAIQLPNVESRMLGGNIGYIRLNSFSMNTADDIAAAIQKLGPANGWIFDITNNGGGYVSAAQESAGFFPGVTKAFQLRYKGNQAQVYQAIQQPVGFTSPVHILINENSASASEMVSASVKEQKGAFLYGQNTFGKGSMQSLFTLSDQSVLKLTTAKFFSPKGSPVHEIGVAPNIETAAGEELFISHRDQLVSGLKGYRKLPALQNVPVTKTFTVKMNAGMKWDGLKKGDVQLIQLGGGEKDIEVEISDDKTIKIIPKKPLDSKGKYLLIIHPNWKGLNDRKMNEGICLEVTVQ